MATFHHDSVEPNPGYLPCSSVAMPPEPLPSIHRGGGTAIKLTPSSTPSCSPPTPRPHLAASLAAPCPNLELPLHQVNKTRLACAVSKPLIQSSSWKFLAPLALPPSANHPAHAYRSATTAWPPLMQPCHHRVPPHYPCARSHLGSGRLQPNYHLDWVRGECLELTRYPIYFGAVVTHRNATALLQELRRRGPALLRRPGSRFLCPVLHVRA